MYVCPFTREQFLLFMKKNAVVAEIGVAEAVFSKSILQQTNPRELHLIDPWEHQVLEAYSTDLNNISDTGHEARYQKIVKDFKTQMDNNQVFLHRAFSTDAACLFSEGYFDWVYIDAMHTEEAVLEDLNAYWPLVREDGFIFGHDYANNPGAVSQKFGVIEGVNKFVQEKDAVLFAITMDAFPSYILSRKNNPNLELLEKKLKYSAPFLFEVRDYPKSGDFLQKYFKIEDREGLVFSF